LHVSEGNYFNVAQYVVADERSSPLATGGHDPQGHSLGGLWLARCGDLSNWFRCKTRRGRLGNNVILILTVMFAPISLVLGSTYKSRMVVIPPVLLFGYWLVLGGSRIMLYTVLGIATLTAIALVIPQHSTVEFFFRRLFARRASPQLKASFIRENNLATSPVGTFETCRLYRAMSAFQS
jgi:hypothetical protein